MSENIFSSYLSVRVTDEWNTTELMDQMACDHWAPFCDMNGNYGLRYDFDEEDGSMFISTCLSEVDVAQKTLLKAAKELNVEIDLSTWKIQTAYWHNGTDCPLEL